ncbi:apolipoprotein N-acyltransferase [Stutzerimonas kirkiae]|uniref:Apolipoprotein N-acyltransferase n=1 Tax=Stutzerimonas kirkiae TaxID=2211392 RepID=A0A4Q9R0L9_9GAMM|nr:apolipoprotein N-acyltransferase [Stutzerimonas kirkiae]TBU90081.1 apolipoprotein N-acyltransferase [Stutzerimonas kirkiae]TBU99059.1 apolipoprotein N-acyltransferase [Stutzerimonas kirkiae]TBV10207.1 apolipoprotein N-acyltransferase [Stutzerimonas kirkiae]TBV11645.1 apolipoprotein N-acyltransferase [Stutzerimonas kirkiae]
MSVLTRPGWPGNLLALLAGALTTLALAPFDIWPLAVLSIALLYHCLRELSPRQAAWRGWLYGFGLFASGVSWVYVSIHDFGAASPALAGLLTLGFVAGLALFFALLGWLWSGWLRRGQAPLADALAFAALWLALDMLRGWILTGFPWLYVGYSQLDGPLAGLAPIGGVWLPTFVIALSAALLANLPCLLRARRGAIAGLALLFAPWLLGLALGQYAWTEPKGAPLSVAAIQGNIEQSMKWDPRKLEQQLVLYRDLSFASRRSDLIVWPETAVPVFREQASGYLALLDDFARQRDAALVTGLPLRQPNQRGEMRYYNGLTVLGLGERTYLKQKLVPFGEYVPLQELLRGLIAFFDLPMSDFARGQPDQPPLLAKGYNIAPYICYEAVYPDFAASLAAASDLLLTVSNDAWFGRSIGPLQHLQMAQMRALEAGRWMIRATNNGITVLIDPKGRISERAPQFEQAVLYGEVTPMQGLTPFLRWRSWPLGLLCALLLAHAVMRRPKAARHTL